MKKILLHMIEFYRKWLAPLKTPCCRFSPTCSAYASDAIREKGMGRGVYLTVKRILKCHPFHAGGWDPVV